MLRPDYSPAQLRFAYCYHVYLRWQTHRLHPFTALTTLDAPTLQSLANRFNLHVLQCESLATEVRTFVSLRPEDSVSGCASKLKGQTSKWLRQLLPASAPAILLSKGYFACTSGKSTGDQLDRYLADQSQHHGYAKRFAPPVLVDSYVLSEERACELRPEHARTILRFHIVLATWKRRGIFGPREAEVVSCAWRRLEQKHRFALLKVSFLPDHAHVAVQVHAAVVLDQLIVTLMRVAQEILWERFPEEVVRAGIEQLWQPSAYVGSFGDLATPQIQGFLRRWSEEQRAAERPT
jgi:REP element-mobilizing transposase RayT